MSRRMPLRVVVCFRSTILQLLNRSDDRTMFRSFNFSDTGAPYDSRVCHHKSWISIVTWAYELTISDDHPTSTFNDSYKAGTTRVVNSIIGRRLMLPPSLSYHEPVVILLIAIIYSWYLVVLTRSRT
ncbi:hypothetical protein HAX54_022215 [Datura stramonium]|uniref:Uncharacterized protein n=1 Tax=Datura stramonium TaxID=4076 RepID=A0ABS8UWA7_DATST|nr:hypothetical protein [Datura stramonium]